MSAGGRTRLTAWVVLIAVLAALAYAGRLADERPSDDLLYRYETAAFGTVFYALILGVVLLICVNARKRDLLALRRPASWKRAAALGFGLLVAMFFLTAALEPLLHGGREQGLTPDEWRPGRAWAFALNFALIALLGPTVEELTYRGLGFTLLLRFGRPVAIGLVGLAFALGHGLLAAFPILLAFGAGLAYLRSRTGSVYPGIILHGSFNGIGLAVSVAV